MARLSMSTNKYRADGKLEARIALILMKAGVTGPEIDECLEWAFGPSPLYVPIYPDWVDRWRKLHPEFPVKSNESFVEWIYVVGFLFCRWKQIKIDDERKMGKFNPN